ncbi:MAG: tetratricopeptide repeat protein [Nocardioides sp.]
MIQTLPGDNPQAYIPADRRRALARGEELATRATGSALLVDVSGFTELTESLADELGERRGAEELGAAMDRVFAALMECLHAWRGNVVYFAGDSITAWLDGDDGGRAAACGLAMQEVMARVGTLAVPGAPAEPLRIKIAVAVGAVHRFVVGDPRVQLIDVLAGQLMDSLAAAEGQAVAGDVVLDAGALASLGARATLRETRTGQGGVVGVLVGLVDGPLALEPAPDWPQLPESVARQWLLPQVWDRMVAGRGEFLADLRPAVPIFVRFGGVDFERDPRARQVLNEFVTCSQQVLDELGGSLLQLTIGEKGAYLYGVFGAPAAHEDDAARACEAALRIREIGDAVAVSNIQIGIATGRLRSGTYGHRERRTFCCLGDAVNLAARLMMRAPTQGVWVHGEVAEGAGDGFDWGEVAAITVKGRRQAVEVRSLRGRAARRSITAPRAAPNALVGRAAELDRLRAGWSTARAGEGQVVVLEAEAGVGKSRLLAELLAELDDDGVAIVRAQATARTTNVTYAGWRDLWAGLLELDLDHAEASDVSEAVERLAPHLVARAPLLGPLLGLAVPDSALTSSFDGALRKASLEDLLGRLLVVRASTAPLVLVVEDAHWIDPLSRDLLDATARTVARCSALMVVTTRPAETGGANLLARRGDHVTSLVLQPFGPDAAAALVVGRHRLLVGRDPAPELIATVVERAEGNAFYLEQLVDYVLAHTARSDGSADPDALQLPSSLHSLVLSRIDAQPEGPRRAVKVASVVGRDFRTQLVAAAYPDLGTETAVHDDLVRLTATRMIDLVDPGARAFAFAHAVTHDVAYDSLPYSVRTVLHGRLGDVLEREADGTRRHLDLLAYHYSRSEDLAKKRHYLCAAAAAARAVYANEVAISYLEQALPLVDPAERHGVLLQIADSLVVRGDWAAAEDAVARARESAELLDDQVGLARVRTTRAELDRKQGRFAEAERELLAAEAAFAEVGDRVGMAEVLHLRGTLCSQQGHPDLAREAYEASLVLREGLGDEAGVAALLTNLALVAEDEDDLDEAERLSQEGLARRRVLDDQRAVAVSLTNMGMLATARDRLPAARERFIEAQTLAERVGDPWLVAVNRHNLGNVDRDLGDLDSAGGHFKQALGAYAERDDRWSLAHLFEDIALWLLCRDADVDAVWLVAAAGRVRDEIGAPRFSPTETALRRALLPSRSRLPAEAFDRAEAAGARSGLGRCVTRAEQLLGR